MRIYYIGYNHTNDEVVIMAYSGKYKGKKKYGKKKSYGGKVVKKIIIVRK